MSDTTYCIMGKPYCGARHNTVLRNGYTSKEEAERDMEKWQVGGTIDPYAWVKRMPPHPVETPQ